MRAALLTKSHSPLEIVEDIDIVEPGPGQVLVKIAHCGICHSDLTVIDSPWGGDTPTILGHEAAGVVAAAGPGVTSLRVGDPVVLSPIVSCGMCYWCGRGQPTLCADGQSFASGRFPDGSSPFSRHGELVQRGLGVGAFGEYTVVAERAAIKVPPDVPLDVVCVIGCAVQTGVGAVLNTAAVEPGATVLVMGLGGIGLAVVQGARLAGALRIIASDPVAARRDVAADFGATDLLDPSVDDVVARSRELTGGIGPDYAFDAVGSASLVEAGLLATRVGGMTVMVGAPAVEQTVSITPAVLFLTQEKTLRGCLLGSSLGQRDIPRLVGFWRQGRLDLERLITHRRPLAAINDGLADLRASRGIRTVISI